MQDIFYHVGSMRKYRSSFYLNVNIRVRDKRNKFKIIFNPQTQLEFIYQYNIVNK